MLKLKNIQEQVSLAPYTTMKVGGKADYFITVHTQVEVKDACVWAQSQRVEIFVLGEGSNIVVGDAPLHKLVIKNELLGFELIHEDNDSVTLVVGAGEHWDGVVERTVAMNLSGIEAMSAIPGTAGAGLVQNAGAYGQEIADTLTELEAYDTREQEFVTLKAAECGFAYRDSMFKGEAAGRYVITAITLKLSKAAPKFPTYESLKRYLTANEINNPTLIEIRDAVMAVRAKILPDPRVVPNSGSFFKSPIVNAAKLKQLEAEYESVPSYKYGDDYKIAAGWIVEQCGFKGQEHFGLRVHPHHALVITNPNHAGYADLMKLVNLIVETAQAKFGLTLEHEPQFIV